MNPYDPDGTPPWRPRRPPGHVDADYDLSDEPGGVRHGVNGRLSMTVQGGAMWKRRAIQGFASPSARHLTWLVGELAGVRCYAVQADDRIHVVLTTEDLYP